MGFFDFFRRAKKVTEDENILTIYSPLAGEIIPIEDIPDEAFSQKLIGDGIGINPTGDTIYAPCDADDISIFETNHAVSFETADGLELIVHFGIDTVKLEGKGFERIAEDGSSVKKGDPLVKFDLEFMKENAKSVLTPVIISNMDEIKSMEKLSGKINPGDPILKIKK